MHATSMKISQALSKKHNLCKSSTSYQGISINMDVIVKYHCRYQNLIKDVSTLSKIIVISCFSTRIVTNMYHRLHNNRLISSCKLGQQSRIDEKQ